MNIRRVSISVRSKDKIRVHVIHFLKHCGVSIRFEVASVPAGEPTDGGDLTGNEGGLMEGSFSW